MADDLSRRVRRSIFYKFSLMLTAMSRYMARCPKEDPFPPILGLTTSRETTMRIRTCTNVRRLILALISLLLDAGLSLAFAQTRLDAAYTATLAGLPIGEISWTVELHEDRFKAAARGAITGFLRVFSHAHGDVSDMARCPKENPFPPISNST
jgi:hypothetical protein